MSDGTRNAIIVIGACLIIAAAGFVLARFR
jgi:hypothetical protein